jgi:hypothetical protein
MLTWHPVGSLKQDSFLKCWLDFQQVDAFVFANPPFKALIMKGALTALKQRIKYESRNFQGKLRLLIGWSLTWQPVRIRKSFLHDC